MTPLETLKKVVDAWESLPGGRNYTEGEIADWLRDQMAPAIQEARETLKRNETRVLRETKCFSFNPLQP